MNFVALSDFSRFFTTEHAHVYNALSLYYYIYQKKVQPHFLTFDVIYKGSYARYNIHISKTFLKTFSYKHLVMCSIAIKYGHIPLLEFYYFYLQTPKAQEEDFYNIIKPLTTFKFFFEMIYNIDIGVYLEQHDNDIHLALKYGNGIKLIDFYLRYIKPSDFIQLFQYDDYSVFLKAASLGCFQVIEKFQACVSLDLFTQAFKKKGYYALCSALLNGHGQVLHTFKQHIRPDIFQEAVCSKYWYSQLKWAIKYKNVETVDLFRQFDPKTFLHQFEKQNYWILNYACLCQRTDIINYFTQHISEETMSRAWKAWHALQIDKST